ncbi:hypothetical protein D5a_00021 [Faustovirus]|nr:hypothetical protein D5a_00021 [Faustovirus]
MSRVTRGFVSVASKTRGDRELREGQRPSAIKIEYFIDKSVIWLISPLQNNANIRY